MGNGLGLKGSLNFNNIVSAKYKVAKMNCHWLIRKGHLVDRNDNQPGLCFQAFLFPSKARQYKLHIFLYFTVNGRYVCLKS